MNDGSKWVVTADIGKADRELLAKLYDKLRGVLEAAEHGEFECFDAAEGRVWYGGCHCEACKAVVDQLDVAQAELTTGYKSVAITSDIADSAMTPGWRRVAAWFANQTGERERSRAVKRAARELAAKSEGRA